MARRRVVQQQEKRDFLSENPELVEFETQIRPSRDEWTGRLRPVEQTDDNAPNVLEPQGEDITYQILWKTGSFPVPEIEIPGIITTAPSFEGDSPIVMSASPEEEINISRFIRIDVPSSVVVTEAGFGVASVEDLKALEKLPEDPLGSAVDYFGSVTSIGGEESLDVSVEGLFVNPNDPEEYNTKDRDLAELEGRSLGFDFDIVGGSGDIIVEFMSSDGTISQEVYSPGGGSRLRSQQPETNFQSNGPEDGFTDFSISTTGDLEIIVVGIDLTTGMGDPIEVW